MSLSKQACEPELGLEVFVGQDCCSDLKAVRSHWSTLWDQDLDVHEGLERILGAADSNVVQCCRMIVYVDVGK
jgi:hypothetical protein